MGKPQKYDFITAGIIYLLSALFLVESFNIKEPDSRILPRTYAIILIICATALIVTRLKKKGEDSYDYSGTGIAMAMVGMMLAYVGLTYFVPLYVTTPLFLICSMYYLGMKKWKVLLPIAVGMDVFIYLVFGLVFKVPIPMGILFG